MEKKDTIRKEMLLAITGIALLAAAYVLQRAAMQDASPLVLLLIVMIGFILAFKFRLAGGIFLFFGGMASAVHPLLISSSYWLIPGGFMTGVAGLLILVKWWHQNGA
jgi:hypothetical protein